MAEVVLGVVGTAVARLLRAQFSTSVGSALRESVALPGSRALGRLASWTKDAQGKHIPELALNMTLLAETFLRMFASGLGTLALVWATVVLLGGFSTMLAKTDFWFITAIVFVQTTRIIGHNSGLEAKFFTDVPTAFSHTGKILGHVTAVTALVAEAPIVAAVACIALSVTRLVGITRLHYGGPNVTDGSNGNLKPALILFYTLVLTQGALFFFWFFVAMNRWVLAEKLKEYFKDTEIMKSVDGINLMDRYVTATLDTCIEKGVVSTMNRTLVTFAAELIQSEYSGDHISAVSVLQGVITRKERTAGVINQICASEKFAGKLFQIIRLRSPLHLYAKAYASEIVAKLACSLRLADIPEAAPSISSLLDGRLMGTSAQTEFPGENRIIIVTDSGPKGKPLFVHGLLILGEFAGDPENCKEIYETTDLVSKIVAPVSRGLSKFIGNDIKTIQIVKASLVVVAKLTSCAGEIGTMIRRKISEDTKIAENLLWILQRSDGMTSNGDQEMEILALEILTRLSLGDRMGEFIGRLGGLLFYADNSPLNMAAVRALNALAADHATCQLILGEQGRQSSLIQQLVDIMRNDASSEYRAATAKLLAQVCTISTTGQDRDRLSSVSGSLSTVLQAFFSELTKYSTLRKELQDINAQISNYAQRRKELQVKLNPTEESRLKELVAMRHKPIKLLGNVLQRFCGLDAIIYKEEIELCDKYLKEFSDICAETVILTKCSSRSVSSFLDLALEIHKLGITAEVFTEVLATLQMDDRDFARKLMEVICLVIHQPRNSNADFAFLKIMRTTTKLVTRMMRTRSNYILYFQQENLIQKLYHSMQSVRDLERDMLLNGHGNGTEAYEPLQSLVDDARLLIWSSQQP